MRIKDYNCKYFSSSRTLNAFLMDVRKYDIPTTEEEEALVERYKGGDDSAREELLLRNLRFIYSLAKIYSRDEGEVVDYVNEGVIGFYTALDKFDASLGYKFTTYAVWYVRREMNFYLNNTRNLINKSNSSKLSRKIETVKQKHFAENGREANTDEIKELIERYYGIEVKEDCDVFDLSVSSINSEVDDDYTVENTSDFSLKTATQNEYEDEIEKESIKARAMAILSMLPSKYADIIKMLFGIGYDREYTTEEIAEKYKIRAIKVLKIRDKAFQYVLQNSNQLRKVL